MIVDWGDGSNPVYYTGKSIVIRDNPDYPHAFGHSYDYYFMLGSFEDNRGSNLACGAETDVEGVERRYCMAKPRVHIEDHWGWCNPSFSGVDCQTDIGDPNDRPWDEYNGWVKVYQE